MADIKRAVASLLLCGLMPSIAAAQSQDEYDALRKRLDQASRDMQALQDELDATQQSAEQRARAASQDLARILSQANAVPVKATQADRPAGCAAVTSQTAGHISEIRPRPYLDGAAALKISGDLRQALQQCAAKGDGRSFYLLTLQRAGERGAHGGVGARWVFDATLTAGELGEEAGLAGAFDMLNGADMETVLALLGNGGRERLTALYERYDMDDAGLKSVLHKVDEAGAERRELAGYCTAMRRKQQALPPAEWPAQRKMFEGSVPGFLEACNGMGIDLYKSLAQLKSVEWAPGLTALKITSGGRDYGARAVADLYDDWQEVLRTSEARWSYSHPKFIQFTDDAGAHYLAGFQAVPRRHGLEETEIFRVIAIDGDMIVAAYGDIFAGVKAQSPGLSEKERDRIVAERLVSLDPAFGFMAGHYSNDYRPAKAVVGDIANYGFLARARPIHEVAEMLEGHLANDG